jgi:hypothetical protein
LAVANFTGADELAILIACTREIGRKNFEIDTPGAAVGSAGPGVVSWLRIPAEGLASTRYDEPSQE